MTWNGIPITVCRRKGWTGHQSHFGIGCQVSGKYHGGEDIPPDELKKDRDAIFLAGGANASARIPLKGTEKKGVLWGWDFLET